MKGEGKAALDGMKDKIRMALYSLLAVIAISIVRWIFLRNV